MKEEILNNSSVSKSSSKKDFGDFVADTEDKYGLGCVFALLTFGLSFILFYSVFFERRYYLNRKLLLSLLKNKEITLKYKETLELGETINVYNFEYKGKYYDIWYYIDYGKFTLNDRLIGLFIGDCYQSYLTNKIINYIKKVEC